MQYVAAFHENAITFRAMRFILDWACACRQQQIETAFQFTAPPADALNQLCLNVEGSPFDRVHNSGLLVRFQVNFRHGET